MITIVAGWEVPASLSPVMMSTPSPERQDYLRLEV